MCSLPCAPRLEQASSTCFKICWFWVQLSKPTETSMKRWVRTSRILFPSVNYWFDCYRYYHQLQSNDCWTVTWFRRTYMYNTWAYSSVLLNPCFFYFKRQAAQCWVQGRKEQSSWGWSGEELEGVRINQMDRSYLDFTYRSMRPIVMGFDMIEVRGAAECCIVPI